MAEVLVTGGAGFIGSHLCERLIQEGYQVICLDNFSTGKLQNINHLFQSKLFKLYPHDVIRQTSLRAKYYFNLACPASPVHYQTDPVRTIQTSVYGTDNILKQALEADGVVIQASTSEIYGDPLEHPQTEDYWGNVNPIGLRSCYNEGKRLAEALCFAYQRQYGVNIKVVRIFNTYGPRMNENDGRVIPNFFLQAIRNDDITIYGDGQQTRSFCFISDLVAGLIKTMHARDDFTGPVNLGNPYEITILELAEKIIKITHSHSKITFKQLPQDDPKVRCPNIDKARKELVWNPQISLDDGLEETWLYYKKIFNK
ncbi:MAG TPA: SDR family oxidoreductase [Bacillota bacterium]|nr:SDR family oxidoreductase [Bacillota bacterium]HOL10545.1 SDR family oxidoreductase [Bacillota bacterium]HPO98263.1 SDR family oxidoreductase [Bacillota bacterium]